MDSSDEYGYGVEVTEGYDEAVIRTRMALRAEGFSIISEAHVGELLDPSVRHGRQYLIMSAWSSAGAHRDVGAAPRRGPGEAAARFPGGPAEPGAGVQVAVHLPCNFVVQETGSSAFVAALDPAEESAGSEGAEAATARDAREALGRVLASIVSQ